MKSECVRLFFVVSLAIVCSFHDSLHTNKPCLEIHSLEILLFVYLWSTMHKKGTEMKMDVQSKQIQYADRDLLVS